MKRKILGLLAAGLLVGPTGASALVIDFEDATLGSFSNSARQSQGFSVTHTGSFAIISGNSGQGATDFSGNGTNRLISFNTSSITIADITGRAFDALGFDGGESWVNVPHNWATQIRVFGTYAAGGTTQQVFDLDLIKNPLTGLQYFQLDNTFRNLSSLAFSGIGGNPEFSFDNVMVSSVPEPGTLALLGLGLAGLRLSRRRKA